jgi:hypothetical protein
VLPSIKKIFQGKIRSHEQRLKARSTEFISQDGKDPPYFLFITAKRDDFNGPDPVYLDISDKLFNE